MTTIQKHEALAAHFEECARLLRAHAALFDDAALENVGVIAALSTRAVRLAARRFPLSHIMREVSGSLLRDLARAAGVRPLGEVKSSDRLAVALLAGARRGYLAAVERIMTADRRRHPLYMNMREDGEERLQIESACPRCGVSAFRDAQEPDACSECGFEFEVIEDVEEVAE